MPSTARAVAIHGTSGPATSLYITSLPLPTAGPDQALVRIHAFGLNRMDLIQRNGNYPVPAGAPSTLGVEFSGVIESFGSPNHSSSFSVGDQVFGLAYGGAYATHIAVSTRMLLPRPEHLSPVQAAAIPETWITATQALHFILGGAKGKSILWHAGASGVSIAGIQLSRLDEASKIFATAGTGEKCAFIEKELGATKAFNYKEEDWVEEVMKETDGKGVDLVVDFVGGSYFQKNLDVVARDGRICMLGLMGGGLVDKVDIGKLLYKRVRVEGSTLRSRDVEYQGRLMDKLDEYLELFEKGELKVFVDTVLPWTEIVKAHELLEANKTMGKIVCTVE